MIGYKVQKVLHPWTNEVYDYICMWLLEWKIAIGWVVGVSEREKIWSN